MLTITPRVAPGIGGRLGKQTCWPWLYCVRVLKLRPLSMTSSCGLCHMTVGIVTWRWALSHDGGLCHMSRRFSPPGSHALFSRKNHAVPHPPPPLSSSPSNHSTPPPPPPPAPYTPRLTPPLLRVFFCPQPTDLWPTLRNLHTHANLWITR